MRKYIFVCVTIFSAISFNSCASKIQDGDFIFLHEGAEGFVEVLKYTGNASTVEVPNKIKKWNVRGAEEGAFKDLPNLQKVHFLGEYTGLSSGAFDNCPKLQNVTVAGTITYISESAFINCPSMATKAASGGSSNAKNSIVGTWKRVAAYSTKGESNRSSWKKVDNSKLGTGIYIPSEFIVNSDGTASANKFNFTWTGSGSDISFTYLGNGNARARYHPSEGRIGFQMPTLYNGGIDLLIIYYE
jgi:hypothetical protein